MRPEVICKNFPGKAAARLSPGTNEEFEKAVEAARSLARECGPGYLGYVWANCGWHYRARSADGRVDVYPSFHKGQVDSYSASVHAPGECGMLSSLGDPDHCKTPKEAIANCLKTARASIAELQAIVEGL